MSNYGEKTFAALSADAAVTALVASRIFPNYAPQNEELPVIVYAVISETPAASLGGWTSALSRTRMQVDCYAKTYREAQLVANAVSGVLAARVEPNFASTQLMRRDLYENETEEHRVTLDFSMWAREE